MKTKYDADLIKSSSPYNYFDAGGNDNLNLGADYSFFIRNLNFFGEAAQCSNGGRAFLNGFLISPDANVTFTFLNRSYSKDYLALFSNGLGESTGTQNEKGTYFGLQVKPVRSFTFSGYYDIFSFPWLKYQVDAPSGGNEFLTQLTYTPSKKVEMYVRHSETQKEANVSSVAGEVISTLSLVKQEHTRFNVNYKVSTAITLGNRLEYATYGQENTTPSEGFLIYQDIDYHPLSMPVSFSVRYALFDTDDYDARIYAYENDVLYSYSITSYYDRGSRAYLTVHYKIKKGLDLWLRYAQSAFTNKLSIGSGYDLIDGKLKSELKAQVRITF